MGLRMTHLFSIKFIWHLCKIERFFIEKNSEITSLRKFHNYKFDNCAS